MKTSNMNLTLLTANSYFGDEAMGCRGGVNYYSLRSLPTPNLLVTKSCADPGFFFRGGGSMTDGQKWTTYFFLSSTYFTVYRGGPMV